MKKVIAFLATVALWLLSTNTALAQCLPAGNYTIDATQPASGTNYQSFNAAVAAMACGIQGGVTFTVAYGSGPYNEQVTIPPIPGASPTARVVFDGQHADSTLLTHDGTTKFATLLLNGADNVTITNLTVQTTTSGAGYGIQLTATADSNVIHKVKILHDITTTNNQAYGIVVSASETSATAEGNTANYLLIDSVSVIGGYGGIRIEGQAANLLKHNRITNNHISQTYNVGIAVDDSDSLILLNNYVEGIRDAGGDGLYIFDARGYFEIVGNKVFAQDWTLLVNNGNLNHSGRSLIANNFLYSSGKYGMFMANLDRVNIFHNTVVGPVAARFATNSKFLDIRNNIFYGTLSYAIEDVVATATSQHIMYDYNIYYSDGPNLVLYGGTTTAFNFPNLASWVAAHPAFNQNSIEGLPIFVSATDFHLLDTLANNKGDNSVGVLGDIDGETRPLAPAVRVDIGADEYNPYNTNLAIVGIAHPQPADCGDSTSAVGVVVFNQGDAPLSGFDVQVAVSGPMGTQNLTATYSGTLAPWTYDTIVVGNINTYQGGIHTFFIEHLLANDQFPTNDTATVSLNILANLGVPTVLGDTACVGSVLELTADATGFIDLEWFSDAALTNSVGSGETYFTPVLNSTQTYYVTGQQGLVERVGKLDPSTPVTYFVSTSAGWGLEFEVVRPILIDSVTMFPLGTGDFTVSIYRNNGAGPVYSSPVPLQVSTGTGGPEQFYLGVMLNPGRYVIGLADTTGVSFARDQSSGTAPYSTPSGFVNIVGGKQGFGISPSASLYYWFYDWVVRVPSCYSAAAPVVAFISDSTADAGIDTAICTGGSATLTAANGSDWLWSTGDVTQTITVSPTSITTYSLTITDANGCTGQPGQVTVNVNALPTVSAGADTAICNGDTATLTATGAVVYDWSNAQSGATINVLAAGDYIVTGTDANSCAASDTVTVTVSALPIVSAGADTDICDGETATLTATGALVYDWSNAQSGATINVQTAGDYIVTGTDANSCAASDTVTVTVNALPTVSAGADTDICDGETATLTATGATSYEWNNAETTTSINVVSSGDYAVTGTDANGCAASDTVTVTVNALPLVNAGADQAICEGETASLVATGGFSYVWSTTETTAAIDVSPAATTEYVVTATSQANCTAQDTLTVTVNTLPTITFVLADTLCQQLQQVTLTASPSGGTFLGAGVLDSTLDLTGLTAPDTYTLQYEYTDANQCSNTAEQDVFVDVCPGIGELNAQGQLDVYPNPFANQLHIIFVTNHVGTVTISIFDLLGKQVHTEVLAAAQTTNELTIHLNGSIAEGAYIIEVKQGNESYRKQLLKIN